MRYQVLLPLSRHAQLMAGTRFREMPPQVTSSLCKHHRGPHTNPDVLAGGTPGLQVRSLLLGFKPGQQATVQTRR